MTQEHTIRLAYINTLLDGGYTRLADKTTNPNEGYIVGGVTKESKMVETFVLIDDHYAEFKELWQKYEMELDEHQATYRMYKYASGIGVGTWVHDGAIYFDLVQHLYSLDVATKLAKEHGEIAIYDCKNQKEILL